MPVTQPTGFGPEVLAPFNIPTNVNAPIQKPPNAGLSFPVFTPPAASSYGTTNPMAVPWTPPDLAGAINRGIETGAHLATDAIANKKSLQQIQAEEQAQKIAIARASAPGAGYYTTTSMGPGGSEVRTLSPAEIEMQRAELANRQAAAEEARARTAGAYGQTAPSQSEIAARQAEIDLKEAQKRIEEQKIMSGFDVAVGNVPSGSNAATSGFVKKPASADQTSADQTSGDYLNLGF